VNGCGCLDPAVFGHVDLPAHQAPGDDDSCPDGVLSGAHPDHLYRRCRCPACTTRREREAATHG
jgi:hypothetical protein